MPSITSTEFFYFNYYIISAFAEFLNNIEQHSYNIITDTWWRECCAELVILVRDNENCTDDIHIQLTNKVMAEVPHIILDKKQRKELLSEIKLGCKSFIKRLNFTHYCGDPKCDWGCGVQSCGGCIDVCRCRFD